MVHAVDKDHSDKNADGCANDSTTVGKNVDQGVYRTLALAAVCAGFAAACKYTAVPFILSPASLVCAVLMTKTGAKGFPKGTVVFLSGVLLAGGGWYIKNLAYSGNPFWPLGYSVFGDSMLIWNTEKAARWAAAHSSDSFGSGAFLKDLFRFGFSDDFAPFALAALGIPAVLLVMAPLILRGKRSSKEEESRESRVVHALSWRLAALTGYGLFFLVFWWMATHRLLRFMVPCAPVYAILCASAAYLPRLVSDTVPGRAASKIMMGVLTVGGFYAICLNTFTTGGFLVPYREILSDPARYGAAVALNKTGTPGKVLLVGEARGFAYYGVPILYNTCWDDIQLKRILPEQVINAAHQKSAEGATFDLQPTETEVQEIKGRITKENISHILVNYSEINRFLSPGNYGLTDREYATPGFFATLEKAGIIERVPLEGFEIIQGEDKNARWMKNVVLYRTSVQGEGE